MGMGAHNRGQTKVAFEVSALPGRGVVRWLARPEQTAAVCLGRRGEVLGPGLGRGRVLAALAYEAEWEGKVWC